LELIPDVQKATFQTYHLVFMEKIAEYLPERL